jgi:hypothetical protein
MRTCILHVTDHEYARILQLNHDALVFNPRDENLLQGLENLMGKNVVEQLRRYDECRVQQHHNLDGVERVEEDAGELAGTGGRFA